MDSKILQKHVYLPIGQTKQYWQSFHPCSKSWVVPCWSPSTSQPPVALLCPSQCVSCCHISWCFPFFHTPIECMCVLSIRVLRRQPTSVLCIVHIFPQSERVPRQTIWTTYRAAVFPLHHAAINYGICLQIMDCHHYHGFHVEDP